MSKLFPNFDICRSIGVCKVHRPQPYYVSSFMRQNGLSFFYECPLYVLPLPSLNIRSRDQELMNRSLVWPLFDYFSRMPESLLSFVNGTGIAQQLLTFNYGRRELHPDAFPLLDEHLDDTCRAFERSAKLFPNRFQSKLISVIGVR